MGELVLEMRGVTKTFPGVIANDNVNLELYAGEIHALLGENGAGKSTLMNCLTGIYKPDAGEIYHKGKPIVINSPKHAVDIGVGMVHQHFRLIPPLSVAENIMLTSGKCPLVLKTDEINDAIRACSKEFNLELSPEAKVWQLSVGEQQRVEIVKLLYRGAEILILDEPSAVLTPQESVEMFKTLRMMADSGKAVVFISHKMNEVMDNSDRITVLRGGKSIATVTRDKFDKDELTIMMVGHNLERKADRAKAALNEVLLEVDNLSAINDRGFRGLKHVSFKLHKGEILGIAGVAGNGQRLLAEAVTGLRPAEEGKILYKKKDVTKWSIKQRKEAGMSFVPEDRLHMGLVPSLNLMDNLILKEYYYDKYSKKGILNKAAIRKDAEECVERYNIKNAGVEYPVRLMSGGNQQKLLVAREVKSGPDLLVVAYPVRGLDIGAINAIHEIMDEERKRGAAIIMISEDLDEVFEMSDNVSVLFDGYMSEPVPVDQITRKEIGALMAGEGLGETSIAELKEDLEIREANKKKEED
ncbi:MAG: ABC transporter ATP-binding protein [Lachnospiraceae bacterium]|nr:ABC transporter ATP-binding protein [Candidatus Equihabitans merdae]